MTTKIELRRMTFYAYHGVAPQETRVGNTFIVDLILTAPLENAVWSDDLSDTINYATVYETVKAEMAIPSRLLEHAAGRILKAFCLETFIYLRVCKEVMRYTKSTNTITLWHLPTT